MSRMHFCQYLNNEQTNFNKILHMHCIDIRIREEWYGIASGIISFRNNIVMALDSCPKCILLSILKMNRQISIKFCICIDIYIGSTIYPITFCFSFFFNWVMALDLCTKCVSPKYLPNKWLHFEKILLVLFDKFKMHTKSKRSGGYLGS